MFRYILAGSMYFLLGNLTSTAQANLIQIVPACKELKFFPLHPREKIAGFPMPLSVDENSKSVLEDYYANVAIAYAAEAKRLQQQIFEKRKRVIQQKERASVSNLRYGKSCNPFSVNSMHLTQQKNSKFAYQLKKEAAELEKISEETLDKGKYFLCVAENIEQILSTKDPVND